MDELIVNVALTGCVHSKADNPALPVTPGEVAADARRCLDAGASMFHVHARDERGNPAWSAGRYLQYVNAVQEAAPGAVVVASCSGRHFHAFQERASSLLARPDMASLTLGSVDFPDGTTSENGRATVDALLARMRELGIKPECEVFNLAGAYRMWDLAENGNLKSPSYVNIILGVALPARLMWLGQIIGFLPRGTLWAGTSIGKDQFTVNGWAICCGGHVRVGLEDALYYEKGTLATNAQFVERVVMLGRSVGREPATPEETREVLGL